MTDATARDNASRRGVVTLLYHYFHPDDVVSARLFTDLGEEFARRGWRVIAAPCNRGCRDESQRHPRRDVHEGIEIQRVWRPGIRQASTVGRIVNALWMIGAWSLRAFTGPRGKQDVVIIGTDPIFGVLAAIAWRIGRPRTKIIHWCHDLYPEALVADEIVRPRSLPVRMLRWLLGRAYHRCDAIADLGACMQDLLKQYGSSARIETLVPWALVEPAAPTPVDPATRASLFGDAKIGLLYSGNFGRAHDYHRFLELARMLRSESIHFCFAARGNKVDELRAAVTPEDVNVSFAGFASEAELEKRLGACDLHLVSLRESWTGAVVPSKFFGAIAAGRGVLFAGAAHSAIAKWIDEYSLGWVLSGDNTADIAQKLRDFVRDPAQLEQLKQRCHTVYQQHFSKSVQLDRWANMLAELTGAEAPNAEGADPLEKRPGLQAAKL